MESKFFSRLILFHSFIFLDIVEIFLSCAYTRPEAVLLSFSKELVKLLPLFAKEGCVLIELLVACEVFNTKATDQELEWFSKSREKSNISLNKVYYLMTGICLRARKQENEDGVCRAIEGFRPGPYVYVI